jgi:hypothetical protein
MPVLSVVPRSPYFLFLAVLVRGEHNVSWMQKSWVPENLFLEGGKNLEVPSSIVTTSRHRGTRRTCERLKEGQIT